MDGMGMEWEWTGNVRWSLEGPIEWQVAAALSFMADGIAAGDAAERI